MIFLDIFFIAVICVLIIDISGFISEFEAGLSRALGYKVRIPKPFSCSLCATHWAGLGYLLFTHFSLPLYAYLLMVCVMTPVISDAIWVMRDFLSFVVALISTLWKPTNEE